MRIFNINLPPAFLLLMTFLLAFVVMLAIKVRRIMVLTTSKATKESRLTLTPNNENQISKYLKVARRFRISGTLVGLSIGIIATEAGSGGAVLLSTNWFFASITGYFLGSMVGAWKSGLSSIGPRREASLTVRARNDFVSGWLIKATYLASFGSVAFFAASLFERAGLASEGVGVRSTILASAVLVAAATDAGTRRLVQASRPSPDEEETLTMNAIARASSSAVAAAGLSLSFWLLSLSAFSALPKADELLFGLVCFSVGIAALVAAAAVWFTSRRGELQHVLALRA